jgi:hypothetical protein
MIYIQHHPTSYIHDNDGICCVHIYISYDPRRSQAWYRAAVLHRAAANHRYYRSGENMTCRWLLVCFSGRKDSWVITTTTEAWNHGGESSPNSRTFQVSEILSFSQERWTPQKFMAMSTGKSSTQCWGPECILLRKYGIIKNDEQRG